MAKGMVDEERQTGQVYAGVQEESNPAVVARLGAIRHQDLRLILLMTLTRSARCFAPAIQSKLHGETGTDNLRGYLGQMHSPTDGMFYISKKIKEVIARATH